VTCAGPKRNRRENPRREGYTHQIRRQASRAQAHGDRQFESSKITSFYAVLTLPLFLYEFLLFQCYIKGRIIPDFLSPATSKKNFFCRFLSLFVAFVVYTDFLSPGDKNEFLLAGLFFFSLHKLWICAREKKIYFCARAQATKKSV
jgi:hypothetical protein